MDVVISGTGVHMSTFSISNEELVTSYNNYVNKYNHKYDNEIKKGAKTSLRKSDVDFITDASGIKKRYVFDKKGILDPDIMYPIFPRRNNEELSIQAEFAVCSAK